MPLAKSGDDDLAEARQMVNELFGSGTMISQLRGGLTEVIATHRTIATRVANAMSQSSSTSFGAQLDAKMASQENELQTDMASLADNELRYETTAKLLQKSYGDLRTAITGNA